MKYYVYILECRNNALYTGYTTDIKRRYTEHLKGSKTCKYTRSFPPKALLSCWEIKGTRSEALKLESAIKKLSKPHKLQLISNENKFKPWVDSHGFNHVTFKQIIPKKCIHVISGS